MLSGRYSNLTLRSCLPSLQIPIYVGDEYEALRDALSAWEEASVKEVGEISEGERAAAQVVLEAAWRDLRQSAHALASVVQVATAQLKGVTAAGVLLHQYHAQPVVSRASQRGIGEVADVLRDLRDELIELRGEVAELRRLVASLPAPATVAVPAVRRSVRNAPKKASADLDAAVVGHEEEMSDLGEFNE